MTILLKISRWFIGTNINPIFTLTIWYIYFSFVYTCNNTLFIQHLYILCTRIIILRLVLEDAKIGWVQLYTYFHQWNQISINNGVPYNLKLWYELVWQLQKVFWPLIFCIYLFSCGICQLIYIMLVLFVFFLVNTVHTFSTCTFLGIVECTCRLCILKTISWTCLDKRY